MEDCSITTELKMTDQNLKNDANLTTNKALFISDWKIKEGETLFFPIQGREGKIVIDWGDGSSDEIDSGDEAYISHKYTKRGVYTIKVDGKITRWSCELDIEKEYEENASINSLKLIRILSYGETSFGPYTFALARNLIKLPENESPRFFENSMEGVFFKASSFDQSINHWDTSNVTNMEATFVGATSFNQPIDKWDTSNVTDMSSMFSDAERFNQPLNDWDTSNVTDMSRMFSGTEDFNQPIDKWDTSNVTCMNQMFTAAFSFNHFLNDWNTSNVKDMSMMFILTFSFNQPLNDWDTSNVTNMHAMFLSTESFNQPLDKWNTSNVTNMSEMFENAKRFNQPLNDWDTSNVTNMSGMFKNSGIDEDNYSILFNSQCSKQWAKCLDD